MELLDLPPELFQRIIYLFVEDAGPVESFAASFTCKTFLSAIQDNIFELQPLGNLLHKYGEPATQLFQRHGAQMLYNRTSRTPPDGISLFIRMTVVELLKRYGPPQDDTRERFTRSLCHAISAHGSPRELFRDLAKTCHNVEWTSQEIIEALPAAAAASGELEILRNLVTCERDLVREAQCKLTPSAFHAAVAIGDEEIID